LNPTRILVLLSSLLIVVSLLNASRLVDAKTAGVDSHGLRLQMGLAKSSYTTGEELRVELSLQNTLGTSITIVFPSSQRFDFFILNREGKEVYRWSKDKVFLAVISEVTLAVSETIDEELTWMIQDLTPGEYTVIGETAAFVIDGENEKLTSPLEPVTINEVPVPEFASGLGWGFLTSMLLMTLLLSRRRRRQRVSQRIAG